MIESKFYFKDEFGQETETRKTYTEEAVEVTPVIDFLFTDFVSHLDNCGFSKKMIAEFFDSYASELNGRI